MGKYGTSQQRLIGVVALALLLFGALGCTPTVGWASHTSTNLFGRTAASFATACPDVGGTLVETTNEQARQLCTCTMPNGDAIICEWQGGRCTTDCHSSEQECTIVRDVAVDWAGLREATSNAADAARLTASLETQNRHAPEPA